MNAQAALQQFTHNVASAPEDHWLQVLRSEAQALIRQAQGGQLRKEEVHDMIVDVANQLDRAGKIGDTEEDAISQLLRQAKGEIEIPAQPAEREPAPAAPAQPDDEDEDTIDESPLDSGRAPISFHPSESLESFGRMMAGAEPQHRGKIFLGAAQEALRIATGPEDRQGIIDELYAMGSRHGMNVDAMQNILQAIIDPPRPDADGGSRDEPPFPENPDNYGASPISTVAAKAITATPFVVRDTTTLPLRDVLYGRHLIRGYVAGLVGISGGGKSTVSMAETFARVSGKPLMGVRVRKPLRCWNINLEDPRDEIDRRAQATCLHYGLTAADIGDRLYMDSGRDQPVVVARTLAGGTQIVEPVVEAIIAEIRARQIDVLTIDPYVSSHQVPENDNGATDMVLKLAWGQVAERGRVAVELVHHLRKIGDDEPTVDAARGAGAFVAATRALRVLATMTKAEAERAGVENPYRYFRVFSGKLSMAPREDKSDWHFLASVDLGNGTADRPSDHVQVAVPWQWPNATDGLAVRDLFAVQKHISEGQWRESAQSPQWAGRAVAGVLDLDIEDATPQARVKSLLKTWIASGALKVVARLDEQRKERKFVEVGQWATE